MEQKFVDLLMRLEEGAQSVAPHAWEIALATAKVEAMQSLLIGGLFLVVSLIVVTTGICLFRHENKKERPDGEVLAGITCLTAVVSAVPIVATFFNLFNLIAWASLSNPEIWIAHQLMN